MRPRWITLAALGSACCLAVTGCGGPEQANSPDTVRAGAGAPAGSVAPGEPLPRDPVADWAEEYCTAVGELVQTISAMPSVDPSTPARATDTSSALLAAVVAGLDRTLAGLRALPGEPVAGADQVRATAENTFSGIRQRAQAVKSRIDARSEGAVGAATGPLDEISRLNLVQGFESVPELDSASQRAPRCQQLTRRGTATSLAPAN